MPKKFLTHILLALLCLIPLQASAWNVALPNGRYTESTEDMRVKVPGGYMRLTREFDGKQWYINRHWNSLQFEFDDDLRFAVYSSGASSGTSSTFRMRSSEPEAPPEIFGGTVLPGSASPQPGAGTGPLYAISRNGAWFEVDAAFRNFALRSSSRYVLKPVIDEAQLPSNFAGIRLTSQSESGGGGHTLEFEDNRLPAYVLGFRWEDRNGDWIDYHRNGRILKYGDRRGTWASMEYTGGRLTGVKDRNQRLVMTFHYNGGGQLIEVRDVPEAGDTQPARSVHYAYNAAGSISRVTDVRGHDTVYGYDAQKRLISVEDAEERTRTIAWGLANKVKSVTEMDGAKTEYEYSYDTVAKQHQAKILYPVLPATGGGSTTPQRRIETLTYDKDGSFQRMELNGRITLEVSKDGRTERYRDEQGRVTTIQRNEFNSVTSVTYPDGTARSATYDPNFQNVLQTADENGTVDVYQYDENGDRISVVRGAGLPEQKVTTYALDSLGRRTHAIRASATASNGVVIPAVTVQYGYDSNDNVTSVTNGEGQTTLYTFNRQGKITSVTEPSGKVWKYTYDAAGNLTSDETPLHHITTYAYDKIDDLTTITDPRQKVSRYQYDDVNNVKKYIDPYNKAYTWQYNGQGLLQSETDAEGRSINYRYDRETRQTGITDGRGNVTSMQYEKLDDTSISGMLPTQVNFPTYTKRYKYDARNRVVQEVDLLGEEGLVTSKVYDRVGRPTEITDANGKTRFFAYDGFGRLLRYTDSLGKTVELVWDNRDNLIQVKDQRGKVLRYEFDKAGNLVREYRPLGQQRSLSYTIDGNLDEETAPNGSRIKYTYDDASRMIAMSLIPAGATTASKAYSFTYDAADNLTAWSDGTQSASLTYDDNNRLLSETMNYGNGAQLSYAYTYSNAGFKKTLTWPDGTVITYQHDSNGELEQVSIPGEGNLTASDWKWMAPQKVTLPGGVTQEYTLDGLLNLTGLTVKNAGQQVVTDLVNTYGKVSEVKEKTVDSKKVTFTYDDEYRVTKAEEEGLLGATETYTLDAAGNRIAASAVSGAWEYDDNGRLTRKGDVHFEYNDNGNLTRKTVGTSGAANTITQFFYDELNRLVEVRDGAETVIATYGYDPFDNRLWKEVGGVRTNFLYSGEGLLAEADAAGNVTVQYGWRPDGLWGTDPLFIKTRFGGSTQPAFAYYHNDHIGTPLRATDKQGNVVWQADYATFGRASLAAANSLTSNLRLAGQYLDAETGLHYNTRRYYDPDTGRYLSEDPLGIGGGWNLYSYAGGNPVNQIDPTGEWIPIVIRFALTAYEFYDTYRTIKESNGCVDLEQLLWDRLNLCKIKWLKKVAGVCSNPCDCLAMAQAGISAAMEGSNSFTLETLVHVRPEGAEGTAALFGKSEVRPISQLKVGDEVLAFSEWKNKGENSGADERLSYEKITDIFSSHREQTMLRIRLKSGETIVATQGHSFKTSKGWRDAILLKVGDKLLLKGGDGKEHIDFIATVTQESRLQPVLNIEVANAHTFFVGIEGVLVHNPLTTQPGKLNRKKDRKNGNRAICNDPALAKQVADGLGISVSQLMEQMKCGSKNPRNPPDCEWHHPIDRLDDVDLLTKDEHRRIHEEEGRDGGIAEGRRRGRGRGG